MNKKERFEVIVVGGGHAGTEAALAAARCGCQTLLVTHSLESLGQMSCNPAIGGIGKGHIVREIDALGGAMAQAIDLSGIQFRRLNERKGPAVRATRAQADRSLYRQAIRERLQRQQNLYLFQASVDDLLVEQNRVVGVTTSTGVEFRAGAVVLTVGTFLGGKIHIGEQQYEGGRAGDPPANVLALKLRERGFSIGRLKTGTPPRIDSKTIDFSVLKEQPGDQPVPCFSFLGEASHHPRQVSCHITATNEQTHDIVRQALDRSPLFSGVIQGTGPRYCPSIEDKVVRFDHRPAHQIFVEPEGLNAAEVYPNGISTSLPYDVQLALVRSIKGFHNATITRPGYAIEYDYFDPRGLRRSLESRDLEGLYLAGQINGTTGYEEAAGQGLLAGVNAARSTQSREPWIPRRDQSYIGVMIDDLIVSGISEPYRMFTSRAEYRLQLREDNADLRLTAKGRELGLVDEHRWHHFSEKAEVMEREQKRLREVWARPGTPASEDLETLLGLSLRSETRLSDLLSRPEVDYLTLMKVSGAGPGTTHPEVVEQLEIQARYAGYIRRQKSEIERMARDEALVLPEDLDYSAIKGLSTEVRQKLDRHRPETLGQASRVDGVTPVAVNLLLVHLKKRGLKSAA